MISCQLQYNNDNEKLFTFNVPLLVKNFTPLWSLW